MTIVDLAKARAFADYIHGRTMDDSWSDAADWIRELADEVESLHRAVANERADKLAASLEVTKLQAERDAAVAALREFYGQLATVITEFKARQAS